MYKFNVALANGGNAHVAFTEMTGNGSVFYTDDAELAAALRGHYKFGKLFTEVAMPVNPDGKPAGTVAKEDVNNGVELQPDGEGKKTTTQTFDNNEDAKDYLAEKYGISRSKMRTRSAIVEAAAGVGVTIAWKE